MASPKHVVEGAFSNPVYTFNKGVVYANELVYEEITNGERGKTLITLNEYLHADSLCCTNLRYTYRGSKSCGICISLL